MYISEIEGTTYESIIKTEVLIINYMFLIN